MKQIKFKKYKEFYSQVKPLITGNTNYIKINHAKFLIEKMLSNNELQIQIDLHKFDFVDNDFLDSEKILKNAEKFTTLKALAASESISVAVLIGFLSKARILEKTRLILKGDRVSEKDIL